MPIASLLLLLPSALPPDCGRDLGYGLLSPVADSTVTAGAVIWSRSYDVPALVDVTTDTWSAVETAVTSPLADVQRLVPVAPLTPGHRYQLRSGPEVLRAEGSSDYGAFEVVEGAVPVRPALPQLLAQRAPSSAGACIGEGVELEIEAAAAPLLLALVEGTIVAVSTRGVLSVPLTAGRTADIEVVRADGLDQRSEALVVQGVGEAKTWSDQIDMGCGMSCVCGRASGGGLLSVIGVGLVLVLRRRLSSRR